MSLGNCPEGPVIHGQAWLFEAKTLNSPGYMTLRPTATLSSWFMLVVLPCFRSILSRSRARLVLLQIMLLVIAMTQSLQIQACKIQAAVQTEVDVWPAWVVYPKNIFISQMLTNMCAQNHFMSQLLTSTCAQTQAKVTHLCIYVSWKCMEARSRTQE